MEQCIRIGTRRSALALKQTTLVIEAIHQKFPHIQCEVVEMVTKGDRVLDLPLNQIGGKAVFVTEIERALSAHKIDIAVHSGKDMPAELAEGLCVQGVLPRANPADVLVTRRGELLSEKACAVIGTGSPRRKVQIMEMYPNCQCKNLRGNVPTRLEKLAEGAYDGIILAAAGLERLGLYGDERFQFMELSCKDFIPAACQGIIAVEGRRGDRIAHIIAQIEDMDTRRQFDLERSMLRRLNAGCHDIAGVFAYREETGYYMDVLTEQDGIAVIQRRIQEDGK